jgi:small-conductance mechanosensitive channel
VWFELKKQLVHQIKVELEMKGVEIPFPQRVLHIAPNGQNEEGAGSRSNSGTREKLGFDKT